MARQSSQRMLQIEKSDSSQEVLGVIGSGTLNMIGAGNKKGEINMSKGDEEGRRYRVFQEYLRESKLKNYESSDSNSAQEILDKFKHKSDQSLFTKVKDKLKFSDR